MRCIGCGAEVGDIEYPVHGEMRTSPGCWALFCEVLEREFSNSEYWPVHQLTVDAYALQHAGHNPALHLLALCLRLERGLSAEQILPIMRAANGLKAGLPAVGAPRAVTLTVLSVHAARNEWEHIASVTDWAQSVWHSFSDSHEAIRAAATNLAG
jgi:hypothetical protein